MAALTNTLPTESLKTPNGELPKIIKIRNPFLSKEKTYSGIVLRKYQLALVDKILEDFEKTLTDSSYKSDIEKYFRILVLEVGGGKTFLLQYLLEKMIKIYVKEVGTKGTIILMAPRNQLISVFQKEIEISLLDGLKKDNINARVYTSLKGGYAPKLNNYDTNTDGIKIVIITDQMNMTRDFAVENVEDLFLTIRDEGMGLDSKDDYVAKKFDGIFNSTFKMHNKFNNLPSFKLVLNATPSVSQKMRNQTNEQYMYKDNSDRDWIKPITRKSEIRTMHFKDKAGKLDLLHDGIEDFIQFSLEINYNKKLGNKLKYLKPVCLVKATINSEEYHLPVDEILNILVNKDIEYAKKQKEFRVENYLDGSTHTIKYPGSEELGFSLIHPVICDQNNPYDIEQLNDPTIKHNVLIVCDLGTYGINIPMLSHSIFLRPSERHEGRIGGVDQFLGRTYRNPTGDDYTLCQIIADTEIETEEEYLFVKRYYLNCISKTIFLPSTKNTREASRKWQNNLSDYDNKSENIDNILLEHGYRIGCNTKMTSRGSNRSAEYDDVRTAVCSVDGCDNKVLELQREIYINEYELDPVIANEYAIKDVMENAHVRDLDGKVLCKCAPHHNAETRMLEHWRKKGDPKRLGE